MKLRKLIGSNPVILALLLTSFTPGANAETQINYKLLVGEWSPPGQCNHSRMVYTADGYVQGLWNSNNQWSKMFSTPGTYKPIPQGFIIYNADGAEFRRIYIKKLTTSTLHFNGSNNTAEEIHQKCPTR
ncbi:hypothetical protein [Coleofasciculus sp. FACHB-1120]|uniref:hypothetical protein n=1 Tax=Coleofasciculus sp. FACHB-1120 TaxID=2692783 RepID=UPI001686D366|nr:hypothetical protein [Coleofasciculus sp. FACHB-1120]MBD2744879.1 hypothetical protein [Coleofasciculus sp. FACHB-1120]